MSFSRGQPAILYPSGQRYWRSACSVSHSGIGRSFPFHWPLRPSVLPLARSELVEGRDAAPGVALSSTV